VSDPLVEVEDLEKRFGGITAVDGASFEIDAGRITGLIGPNGAGKTTTFDLLSGFLTPDGGRIRYRGRNLQEIMRPDGREAAGWMGTAGAVAGVVGLGAAAAATAPTPVTAGVGLVGAGLGAATWRGQEVARRRYLGRRYARPFRVSQAGLVRTFQLTRELRGLTVLENLMLAPKAQPGESFLRSLAGLSGAAETEDEIRRRALETLDLLELGGLADERAGSLSGGQRKLLELGRVLMAEPDLILLDEPIAGINPTLSRTLLRRIESLREEGYSFCVVEHDMDVVMRLSDTVIVMDQGSVLTEGSPEAIRADERVIDAYLGAA
jgi:ABC-type branched-subunit amino acid transport system ATPase component